MGAPRATRPVVKVPSRGHDCGRRGHRAASATRLRPIPARRIRRVSWCAPTSPTSSTRDWVNTRPEQLIMLSSRNRYLILAVGAGISPVAYAVIATVRLTAGSGRVPLPRSGLRRPGAAVVHAIPRHDTGSSRPLRTAIPRRRMGADPYLRRQQHRLRAQRHGEDSMATDRSTVAHRASPAAWRAVVAGQAVRVGGPVGHRLSCSAGSTRSSSDRSCWSSSPTSPTSAAAAAETRVYIPSIASRPSVRPGCSAMCLHARTTPGMKLMLS